MKLTEAQKEALIDAQWGLEWGACHHGTQKALLARGLIEQDPYGFTLTYRITDVGRLALRQALEEQTND